MKSIFAKSTVLILLVGFSFQFAKSQSNNQGVVIYEEIIKMNIQLDSMPQNLAINFPTEQKNEKQLVFNSEFCKYGNTDKKETETEEIEQEGGVFITMSTGSDDVNFRDFKNNKTIRQVDFMGRMFLIEDDYEKINWKLTGKQKQILGYPCQEAVNTDTSQSVSVWFTPAIGISAGPMEYGNLPGLILEVNIDNGEIIITAKDIKITDVTSDMLTKPVKGKKVTKEKYQAIVEEKMEEMGGSSGEGTVKVVVKTVITE